MARRDALLRLHKTLVARRDELRERMGGAHLDLNARAGESLGDAADMAFETGSEEVNSQLAQLESRELNHYRIDHFGLREIFTVFISSCFVGLRKPEEGIYRLALETTQKLPGECVFIDDRALNLESARALGMHVIEMQNAAQLREELKALGIV